MLKTIMINLDLFEELQRAAGDSLSCLYTGAGVLRFHPIKEKHMLNSKFLTPGSGIRVRDTG
jgi:hypothetical protein